MPICSRFEVGITKGDRHFFLPKGTATIYFLTGNLNLGTIKKWGQLYFF